ncbi:fumarylacetoacetate hydrolase family protein [Desertibacillus haloalkaliphilus]|uniref:fumarylacetoacetate hydrolase family protein n=1 Tax=Desertibacillus haloalkaliphilus TaxID=1328930 RepID=UPI001C25DC8F|nr:fumarylacetoacetate hydrolase family protein [Desertibacillus haloalkaliphilus]MBU8904967.1 fumarylacetoacetate hydrolase family protein [Desertibacillus haloalkaliphilus]
MKFVTFKVEDIEKIGLIDDQGNRIIDLRALQVAGGRDVTLPATLLECIQLGEKFPNEVRELMQGVSNEKKGQVAYELSDERVHLKAPIPRPSKNIFCVGKNYAAHAIEMGSEADIPEHPMLFSKAPTAVIGPNETVLRHQDVTDQLDYEGEIAVVIGKKGKAIAKEDALDYVFGYTLLNDITARDLQKRHKQFLLGKSLDTSCPMGPYLVYRDEINDPHSLNIETRVNEEIRQTGNTSQFIFDIATIISTISKGTTLEAGDIIATGTPAGVGKGFNPPKFLNAGDVIEIEVDGLGILRNQVER